MEKNKQNKKTIVYELSEEYEKEVERYVREVESLISQDSVPPAVKKKHCSKCAYYEYCFI